MRSITKKFKNLFLILGLIGFGFSGCGDKSNENEKTQKSQVASTTAPKIEVVQNKNAKEIKVQEKTAPSDQSKSYYLNYNVKSAYDEHSMPANDDASVRVKPRTAVDANMHVRSPYEKVQISMLVKKLSKEFMVKCSACHNDYANGIIGPSLLDKTSDQILQSIADFKTGKKSNPLMNDLIKMMEDKQIKALANEIYEFNQKIKNLKN